LAIDEVGMCTLNLLTLLSQVAGKVKVDDGKANMTVPFGGLNVLIMGDFHQFPPVGGPHIALYRKLVERNTAVIGKAIYLQFDTVVNLHRQWRIDNEGWMQILQRSRDGECTVADLREIRKLIVTNPECEPTDFTKHPWNTAVLVTPRNCVRNMWNRAALQKHCRQTGNNLYICDVEDSIGNDTTPVDMEQNTIIAGMKVKDTKNLTNRIELAIGMQAMITYNVATEADLANGSRGTIEEIILDPRDTSTTADCDEDGVIWLQYPPSMIVFKPNHHEFAPFPGLIPIFPSEGTFSIDYRHNHLTKVHRRQYPMCGGYAFTDPRLSDKRGGFCRSSC
jgi:hypothetical protein